MASSIQTQQQETRPIDPNVKQWAASNPIENVWVSASAGTGKTKVLTDRVLRLLLPRADGTIGTPPHRILCLTYTKAAASEMTLRINEKLGKWVVMNDDDLSDSLRKAMGYTPSANIMVEARRLFAKVVDTPSGLKIMTIHAFCQSVLGRFPLEAGILPNINVLDDVTAQNMIRDTLLQISRQNMNEETALSRLCIELDEASLFSKIQECLRESNQVSEFFKDFSDQEKQIHKIKSVYNAPLNNIDELVDSFIATITSKYPLRVFADALSNGANQDQARSQKLYEWLSLEMQQKRNNFQKFRAIFLTTKEEPRKSVSKGAKEIFPDCEELQNNVALEILDLEDQLKAIRLSDLTYDLLTLAQDVKVLYEKAKQAKGLLDYNDLILKTVGLLKYAQNSVPWVLYKLDGGLDHILLDEAQDTNPAQWDIISLLSEEFFTNQSDDVIRTLFVVGDEKQSIYRFQGAALEEFQYMRFSLSKKAELAKASWCNENLQISFRSTRAVLEFVDAAFDDAQMRQDIGIPDTEELEHIAWRRGQAGKVILKPLIPVEETEKAMSWELPIEIKDQKTPKAKLAEDIASQIKEWLENGRKLESKNRPIRPKDIMVLVRSRDAFVELLIRALKTKFIAVSGADRLILNHHIAVQDMMSVIKFVLQPHDDLSLAEILKSPFISMSDEELENVAYGRDKSLWLALRAKKKELLPWFEKLQSSINQSPLSFIYQILNHPCPNNNVSGLAALRQRLGEDCLDIIDEFVSAVQNYETENIPDLQSFLLWETQNPIEIKREFNSEEDAVRIMTVHGAKGLQAPIVFLPDTLRSKSAIQNKVPRLIMPRRSGADVPVWSPRKSYDCKAYQTYFDKVAAQETAEYKRLFYVAATRAEDELYICGAESKSSADEESWYFYAERAFDILDGAIEVDEDGVKRHYHLQSVDLDIPNEAAESYQKVASDLPEWIYKVAPEEPNPPRPFRPSRPSESECVNFNPLSSEDNSRFKKGLLIHTLLQFLPNLSDINRETAARRYLVKNATDFSEEQKDNILSQTLSIMQESNFSEIFSPHARAEVSLTGYLPSGQLISGQIDRLLIKESDILIIDYKTNQIVPDKEEGIPKAYLSQMKAYKEALKKIYPDKNIKSALLWTSAPKLMTLSNL